MKSTRRMMETMIAKKLKKEDPIELPMDEKFFENMHDRIMVAVEKKAARPVRWRSKTWVFLESNAERARSIGKKIIKTSFVGLALAASLTVFETGRGVEMTKIPAVRSELVIRHKNTNDFYAKSSNLKKNLRKTLETDHVQTGSL